MTIVEIKALIAKCLEGQGSAIDAGGALPKVLNGIIDTFGRTLEITPAGNNIYDVSKARLAEYLGISETDVDALRNGEIKTVIVNIVQGTYKTKIVLPLTVTKFENTGVTFSYFGFLSSDDGQLVYVSGGSGNDYAFSYKEV